MDLEDASMPNLASFIDDKAQTRPMGLPYVPISWGGGLGGQCRHRWHTWSVWVKEEFWQLEDPDCTLQGSQRRNTLE